MKALEGKVTLITGAKGGLGAFITKAFLAAGAKVVGVSRSIQASDFPHPGFAAMPAELSSGEAARKVADAILAQLRTHRRPGTCPRPLPWASWPKEEALGKVIVIGRGLGPQFEEGPREIVGISGNVTESGLANHGQSVMYVPQSQMPNGLAELASGIIPLAWIVRTAGDPLAIRAVVEREMHSVDAALPVGHLRTVDEVVSQSLARENFNMLLLTLFAAIALLLAAIGIYGLISYGVEQRMQEIGIRVALGAARGDVLRMIVMQGAKLAAIGVAVGLAAAFGLTRFLASLLYGVKAADPMTFAGVAVAIGLVALAASYIPALRAAAVDPNQALRHE